MIHWIKCTEKMPIEGEEVVVIGNVGYGNFKSVARYKDGIWRESDGGFVWTVEQIHTWCELPKGEEGEGVCFPGY